MGDYIVITQKRVTAQGNETQSRDYILKLDMAKEIQILENVGISTKVNFNEWYYQVEEGGGK